MHYQIIQVETEEQYRRYYHLRWQLLRAPWKQPEGSQIDDIEAQSVHLMMIDESDECIGVGRLHFNTETEAQIRYMAVVPEHEKQGVGSSILEALEAKARQQQCKNIVLHARENAVGFYQKKGYELLEKSHLLFGTIQHFRMCKIICCGFENKYRQAGNTQNYLQARK